MDFLQQVIDFFNNVLAFIHQGIYDFVTAAFAQFVIWSMVAMVEFKIMMIGFAWDVAQQILAQLDVSSYINAAFGSLEPTLFNFICFLKIPEAVNIIMSAYTTRYVLNFMGM